MPTPDLTSRWRTDGARRRVVPTLDPRLLERPERDLLAAIPDRFRHPTKPPRRAAPTT